MCSSFYEVFAKEILMEKHNPSSSTTDRKTIEKNRRAHLKALYAELNSLVPHQSSREVVSLHDQLHEATYYIKGLQIKLEKMKEKRDKLMGKRKPNTSTSRGSMEAFRSPQLEIHEMGTALEVVLITGMDCHFMFNETIRVLHEEGAEVVNANFSVVDDIVYHTIHSKVGESAAGHGSRISGRLKKFVYGDN